MIYLREDFYLCEAQVTPLDNEITALIIIDHFSIWWMYNDRSKTDCDSSLCQWWFPNKYRFAYEVSPIFEWKLRENSPAEIYDNYSYDGNYNIMQILSLLTSHKEWSCRKSNLTYLNGIGSSCNFLFLVVHFCYFLCQNFCFVSDIWLVIVNTIT